MNFFWQKYLMRDADLEGGWTTAGMSCLITRLQIFFWIGTQFLTVSCIGNTRLSKLSNKPVFLNLCEFGMLHSLFVLQTLLT